MLSVGYARRGVTLDVSYARDVCVGLGHAGYGCVASCQQLQMERARVAIVVDELLRTGQFREGRRPATFGEYYDAVVDVERIEVRLPRRRELLHCEW